ncbi:MAG: hypothetical protein IKM06_00825 [Clostridia bacterium]|nr:hypothetical protein [Clostridia bacterium]
MNGTERVKNVILGKAVDRQPIYGWVRANLDDKLKEGWGSADNFEDAYEFDMAHIFGGPNPVKKDILDKLFKENGEITPELLLKEDYLSSPLNDEDYTAVKAVIQANKSRGRFCYVQTPGFFEQYNGVFGIQNHLMYLLLYPDEIKEIYRRQAEWTIQFADKCIELGADMIHISDDWGSQKDLMFNPDIWYEFIYPNLKKVVDHVHSKGVFASLHSDGCIKKVVDGIVDIGFDVVHPWQESAGMDYDTYLEKYSDKFAILGGICVQTAIGLLPKEELEQEIKRVFNILKGKRWICCTTHFVQDHCTLEDLRMAFDLIYKLARS